MSEFYVNPHTDQYAPPASPVTRKEGCVWTSGANGVDASTGGDYKPTPDKLHSLVKRHEEVNPNTPGWHQEDLKLALARYGMPGYEVRTGQGWRGVGFVLGQGRYVVLQGDSDVFSDAKCSGAFDGDHAIGVHPRVRIAGGRLQRWIDDPICPHGRWEDDAVLRRYAEKLNPGVHFGAFRNKVPQSESWRWKAPLRPEDGRTRTIARYVPNKAGEIVAVDEYETRGMDVPCTAPKRYEAAPGKPDVWSRELVKLVIPGKKRNGWLMDARFAVEE